VNIGPLEVKASKELLAPECSGSEDI
jgi:hypothetical protein